MKADVQPAPLELNVPSWVPEPITRCIEAKYALDIDHVYEALQEGGYPDIGFVRAELANRTACLQPLACDPRMRGVWRELSKQHGGGFLHPALSGDQDAAMVEVFNTAWMCRQWHRGTTTIRSEIEQERDHFLAKANVLDHDASTLGFEYFSTLIKAAQAYRDHANEIATSLATALERKHDGRARWVALAIANKFRTLFGSPMYGLTAIITSVVLNRPIDSSTVRHWCAPISTPAVNAQKIAP